MRGQTSANSIRAMPLAMIRCVVRSRMSLRNSTVVSGRFVLTAGFAVLHKIFRPKHGKVGLELRP